MCVHGCVSEFMFFFSPFYRSNGVGQLWNHFRPEYGDTHCGCKVSCMFKNDLRSHGGIQNEGDTQLKK